MALVSSASASGRICRRSLLYVPIARHGHSCCPGSKCSTSPGPQVPRTTEINHGLCDNSIWTTAVAVQIQRATCHSSTMNQPSMRLHESLARCAKAMASCYGRFSASKVRRQKSKSKVSRGKLKMIILTKWRNRCRNHIRNYSVVQTRSDIRLRWIERRHGLVDLISFLAAHIMFVSRDKPKT